jgi:hypothetical protein
MIPGDYHLFTGGFSQFPVKIVAIRTTRERFSFSPSSYYWKTTVDIEMLNGSQFPADTKNIGAYPLTEMVVLAWASKE